MCQLLVLWLFGLMRLYAMKMLRIVYQIARLVTAVTAAIDAVREKFMQ